MTQITTNREATYFRIKNVIHFGKINHRTKGVFFFLDLFNRQIIGK